MYALLMRWRIHKARAQAKALSKESGFDITAWVGDAPVGKYRAGRKV